MTHDACICHVALIAHRVFFNVQVVDEEGYIIRVSDNALTVMVPKYGIEVVSVYLIMKKQLAHALLCLGCFVFGF